MAASPPGASPPPVPPERTLPPAGGRLVYREPERDERRQLPPHENKLERVSRHAEGVVTGLTNWIDLRIAVVRREIQETIEEKKRQAQALGQAWGITAALGLAAALIALFFLGFLLSALWDQFVIPEGNALWSLTLGYLTLLAILGAGAFLGMRRAEKLTEEITSRDDSDD
jgi:hypothetical protein